MRRLLGAVLGENEHALAVDCGKPMLRRSVLKE